MDKYEKLDDLLSHSEAEILQNPSLTELLRTTYIDFFGNGVFKFCRSGQQACIRRLILMKTGKLSLLEKVANRTLVPSDKFVNNTKGGVIYCLGSHISADIIHDEQAILLLKKGLPEDFFKVLPRGYKKEQEGSESVKDEAEKTEESKPEVVEAKKAAAVLKVQPRSKKRRK
jgi:hypothetical protein